MCKCVSCSAAPGVRGYYKFRYFIVLYSVPVLTFFSAVKRFEFHV